MDHGLEPLRIDEGLDDQDRVPKKGLPVGAEAIEGRAQDAGIEVGLVGVGEDEKTAVVGDHAATPVTLGTPISALEVAREKKPSPRDR